MSAQSWHFGHKELIRDSDGDSVSDGDGDGDGDIVSDGDSVSDGVLSWTFLQFVGCVGSAESHSFCVLTEFRMNQTELGRALPFLAVAAAIQTCVIRKRGTQCLSVSVTLV